MDPFIWFLLKSVRVPHTTTDVHVYERTSAICTEMSTEKTNLYSIAFTLSLVKLKNKKEIFKRTVAKTLGVFQIATAIIYLIIRLQKFIFVLSNIALSICTKFIEN